MNEKHSLLNNIRSKYILKDILILAFGNMNSVLKFVAYNKVLLNRLDINLKDYYNFEIETVVEKKIFECSFFCIKIDEIVLFYLFLILHHIFFFGKKIEDEELIEGYNKKMKNYVDIMNNYINTIYIVYFSIYYFFLILNLIIPKLFVKGKFYLICEIISYSMILSYFIEYMINFFFKKKINKLGSDAYDYFIITCLILVLILDFMSIYLIFLKPVINGSISNLDDEILIYLNQINGININKYELPKEFYDLNKAEKIKMIFKKENMTKYTYILNDIQKMLINKINQIRNQSNIPELKYDKYQKLPNYIINPKTELIFKEEKNIYKFYNYYYLIKYPISESQNDINDYNFIKIIKINYLDRINIIRKDNYEYIALYTDQFNENNTNNNRRVNNNINIYRNLRLNPIILTVNNINTEDRLNNNNQ